MKKIVVLLMMAIISILALTGCNMSRGEKNMDVKKITFIRTAGDVNIIEMFVITSDYTMENYVIRPHSGVHADLFAGELPSEEEYTYSKLQISEESWNNIVDALSQNDFMSLPEEIPCSEKVYDAPSYYIEVETAEAAHRTGGYDAGHAADNTNKRFKNIMNSLDDVIQIQGIQPDR